MEEEGELDEAVLGLMRDIVMLVTVCSVMSFGGAGKLPWWGVSTAG